MTITGAQKTKKPKTTVTSALETFASLHKLFFCSKFDDTAWL